MPLVLAVCLAVPKWRGGVFQKLGLISLGLVNYRKSQNIWVHAVSFGEVKTIEPFVVELQKKFPQARIWLSVGTLTGYGLAEKLFRQPSSNVLNTDDIVVFYAPFDFYFAVKNWFSLIKPSMLIIAETEIWPELVLQARENKTTAFIINARLTEKSVRNYSLIKPLVSEVLNSFKLIIAQSETNRRRFLKLGLDESKLQVLPNLKYDNMKTSAKDKVEKIADELGLNLSEDFVLVAGSTHKGEEELIVKVLKVLKKQFISKSIKLIIAPRHLERLSEVEALISAHSLTHVRRSENTSLKFKDILLIDSMGELQNLYALGDVAFLGGTWTKIGGHNPLEPVGQGCLTLVGPYTYKIKDLAENLEEKGFLLRAITESEILKILEVKLSENSKARLNIETLKMPESVAMLSLDLIRGATSG